MQMSKGYTAKTQTAMNLAWFLPRPKRDRYKGGMPLHCEKWLVDVANDILGSNDLKILNLFCGMNTYGIRIDLNKEVNPDYIADAHNFAAILKGHNLFDFILADPPYSNEEATEIYGTPKLNYKGWTNECDKILRVGGLLCVYHKYVMPNPNPAKYRVVKRVFIGTRTYHLPRVAIFFQKKS
jgi:hypothetical protein